MAACAEGKPKTGITRVGGAAGQSGGALGELRGEPKTRIAGGAASYIELVDGWEIMQRLPVL